MSLGLLPSLLSHARRTLTKVLRLDTDYTTARAGYLDNIEASAFTTRVQAGLNANGYTTTRAGYLDNIEASNFTTRVQAGLTAQGVTTTRAGYLDQIEQTTLRGNVQSGMTTQGYTTTRAGYLDNIEASNFTTRVQAGLNANGYTTTVSARVDTSVSTRRQRFRTQPRVETTSGGTLVSIGGAGKLHSFTATGPKGGTLSVVVDGVTVITEGISVAGGDEQVLMAHGRLVVIDSGTANPVVAPSVDIECTSSLSVSVSGSSGGGTYTVMYSSAV